MSVSERSDVGRDPRVRPHQTNRALWFAVAGGPVAWSIDMLTSVAVDHDYCAHARLGPPTGNAALPLLAISVVALVVTIAAGLAGWRSLGTDGPDTGLGETDLDRRRFMARFGVVISVLTFFAIMLRMVTVFFVAASTC